MFRKKRNKNKILVKCGKNDWRSYPEPGSLVNIKLEPDNNTDQLDTIQNKKKKPFKFRGE